MPRERKQRGAKHAEKRKLEREEQEKKYLEAQERDVIFYDRPKNPFGYLTREDEKFFGEVYDEFKRNEWDDDDAKEAFIQNVFVEMRGKELKVATSEVGRFLEQLLAECPRAELQRIMTAFKGHTVELARHRFGSYALEKIAGHVGVFISKDIEGSSSVEEKRDNTLESLETLFIAMLEVEVPLFHTHK
jgi:nucleolar protein 9